MKTNSIFKRPAFIKTISIAFFTIVMSVIAFAQDKKVDVNISTDKGGGNFWASPWVWVIGGAVFILLLVALLRGGSKSE